MSERDGRAHTLGRKPAPPFDVIEGNRNPELLFPTELFPIFIRRTFITLPKVYPMTLREYSRDLFRNPEELTRLEPLVAGYVSTLRRELELGERLAAVAGRERAAVVEQLEKNKTEQCRELALALRAVRRQYGRERFDRFLYEAVTKNLTIVSEPPGAANGDSSEYLRNAIRIEKECQ
jgi:hypothetical protein